MKLAGGESRDEVGGSWLPALEHVPNVAKMAAPSVSVGQSVGRFVG